MAGPCTYHFTDENGNEVSLKGLAAFQAYLAEGGLEHLFPKRKFPWTTGALPERILIDGKERWTVNSNGQLIHQTEEGIRSFYKWFGDSKVVDSKGRPKVLYHLTPDDIREFKLGGEDKLHTPMAGSKAARSAGIRGYVSGPGIWMSDDREKGLKAGHSLTSKYGEEKHPNVIPLYAKLESPLIISSAEQADALEREKYRPHHLNLPIPGKRRREDGRWEVVQADTLEFPLRFDSFQRQAVLKDGYDSIVYAVSNAPAEFIALSPNQIKSAIGNSGAFGPETNDIRYSRPDQPRFYSALKRAFIAAPDKVFGNPEQIKLWINGNASKYDVKKDEIYWSGLNDWLDLQTGKVNRDDVLRFMDENGVKVEDVVLGETAEGMYKKLSDAELADRYLDNFGESVEEEYGPEWTDSRDDVIAYLMESEEGAGILPGVKHNTPNLTLPGGVDYRELVVTIPTTEKFNERDSTHFGDVGQGRQIAWIRHNTRTDADGNTGLFLEEVQSQRGQEGRSKGFVSRQDENAYNTYRKELAEKYGNGFEPRINDEEYTKLMKLYKPLQGIPPAPFVTDSNNKAANAYISLLLKKAVSQAIDDGKNFVAWTTGDQQADRYDLSKQVDSIEAGKNNDNTYDVRVYYANNTGEKDFDGKTKAELVELLGKELADKIESQENKWHIYEGVDLKVGGGWTQAMYGNERGLNAQGKPSLIMQAANELARKFGGEIGSIELLTGKDWQQQPALIITPAMREKILGEGIPLFAREKSAVKKPSLLISEADAKQYLLDNFGVGINNLIDNGVLRFTNGKEAWPEAARRAARGDEEAVYINGKAYIDLTATGRDRLNAVVLHELGEHYSLRRMLGDNAYRSLQQQVTNRAKIAGSRAEKVWNTVKRNYDHLEEGGEAFVSEVIAKLGELDPKAPWYRRLISQIKAFLMQHGLARGVVAGTITEADLHILLRASLNSAARGFEKGEPRLLHLSTKEENDAGRRNTWQRNADRRILPNVQPGIQRGETPTVAGRDSTGQKTSSGAIFKEPSTPREGKERPSILGEDGFNGRLAGGVSLKAAFSRPEKLPEKIVIDGKERHTTNSDGKQIHPTEQGVRNFWKWFNDSAVVDEKGRPQVMYHGTTRDFSSFDVGESGQKDSGWYGTGFYFTPDTLTASAYADYDQEATGQNVIPVYLKIENPFEWTSDVVPMKSKDQSDGFRRLMMKMGIDGVFAENKYADPKFAKRYEVVVFEPNQIKSATGNTGDFSGENNDIRFSRLGDKIEQLNRTPEGDNTWLGDVVDTLDKAADTVFRKRLAFLSVKQIIEVAKHYMPGLNEYENLMQSREALISGWLRKADRLVSETWRKLPKPIQRQLANVMHESTLEDVHAGLDWSGIREVFDKEGPQGFEAYTQYNLAPSYKAELLRKAEEAGATILDGKAIFRTEAQARNFLPEIEQSEATLKKFRQKNFPEIFAKEEARENEYRRLAKLYKALPEQAQKVYTEATVMHDDLFKDRLEELQKRIVSAVENGQKQKALLAQIREKFESQSINWYYAPLARYGSYWFYGEDANGERWFRTFETKRQWERGKKEFQGKLLGEGRNLDNLELLEGEQVSDSFIKSVQSQITETVADKDTRDLLQDQIYQMFLQTLPDISVRHSSMHRKGTKGYTEDAMRAYSSAMHHGATQLGNMKYGRDMRQVLTNHNEAKAVASGKERRDAYQAIIDAAEMLRRDWKGKVEKGVLESELAEAKEEEDEDQVRVLNEAIKIRDRLGADHPSPNGPLDYIIEEKQKILGIASSIPMSKLTKASDVLDELVLAYDHMVKYSSTDMDRVASMLNQMNFVNMLGFGLSSGIVNMIQTPGVAMPVAVGRHGAKTVPAFNKAFMQFMKTVASGKRDVDGNASITEELRTELEAAKSANNRARIDELEDEIRMLEGFKDDGTISRTQTFDIIGVGREGASYGGRMQEFSKWAGWMFHHGERLNREVTLTAAYRLEKARLMGEGKSAKMAHLDAIEYARYVNNRAHLDYSSENAARIFRGPLARIALQFKKYQQGMLFLWGKSLADAIGKIDEAEFEHGADGKLTANGRGLFEAAKRNRQEARRTFIALVFMQGSLAGALSMPTMGAISALYGMLGAMIGDDDDDEPWDLEKDLRLGLAKYLGDVPAEIAAKGFVNALTSVNLASRLDQADIFFKEPLKEMEGRDAATAYLAEVLGPTGGTVAKVWQGMSYLADGYWMRGAESMTPKFVGDIVKAARFAEEGAKTLDNMPLKDMSAMETFMQGLGFGSSALERRYAERGFAKEREAAIKDTRTKIMREAAWAKIKGEPVDMAAIRAWNLKHPEKKILAENISASMKGIKQSVKIREEKGYSVDPKLEYLYEENEVMD